MQTQARCAQREQRRAKEQKRGRRRVSISAPFQGLPKSARRPGRARLAAGASRRRSYPSATLASSSSDGLRTCSMRVGRARANANAASASHRRLICGRERAGGIALAAHLQEGRRWRAKAHDRREERWLKAEGEAPSCVRRLRTAAPSCCARAMWSRCGEIARRLLSRTLRSVRAYCQHNDTHQYP